MAKKLGQLIKAICRKITCVCSSKLAATSVVVPLPGVPHGALPGLLHRGAASPSSSSSSRPPAAGKKRSPRVPVQPEDVAGGGIGHHVRKEAQAGRAGLQLAAEHRQVNVVRLGGRRRGRAGLMDTTSRTAKDSSSSIVLVHVRHKKLFSFFTYLLPSPIFCFSSMLAAVVFTWDFELGKSCCCCSCLRHRLFFGVSAAASDSISGCLLFVLLCWSPLAPAPPPEIVLFFLRLLLSCGCLQVPESRTVEGCCCCC